jgi:NAD(P)-dependent dehydrogenase (short-subunit alcohol dehydrogenase family)
MKFNGKTVVITGGASGVGLELGLRFATAGANIVLADIEKAALDAAVLKVTASGARVIGHVTDVTKRDQVDALRDRAIAEFGSIQTVFNNAGVGGGGGAMVWDTPEKVYRWTMDVNFFGPLNGILSFMPHLMEQDEETIMSVTSSGAGLVFPPSAAAYSASKAALIALVEIMAMQLQMSGSKVKASIIFPGPHVVETNLFSSHRNVQEEYRDADVVYGGGVETVEQFQDVMQMMIGTRVQLTKPADFTEEVYQSLLRGDFYVLPLTDKTKQAIRTRYEIMLDRGQPVIPDMFDGASS